MRKISTEKLYKILIFVLIFGISQLSIGRIHGFSLYPDEFGYWASAAPAAGYDWSVLASLGSYYSFGYSLLLTPILIIFKGGVLAYRVAVFLNFVFIGTGFVLLLKTADILFGKKGSDIRGIMLCAIACFYPPWILYSQMTMAESLITFLFILMCYLLVHFSKEPTPVKGILLIILAAYMYSVHMRTVGVIIAFVIVFALIGLSDKRSCKYTLIFFAVMAASALVLILLKGNVVSKIFSYASAEDIAVNSYGSQGWKIRDILTGSGFAAFIAELFGKIYYLVISTCALSVFAFSYGIRGLRAVLSSVKKRECANPGDYAGTFVLLTTVAEIMISCIYMHGSDRADCLLYGRYEEFVAPVLILFGAFEIRRLMDDSQALRVIITCVVTAVSSLVLVPVFNRYYEVHKLGNIRGFFVSGIGYLNGYADYDTGIFVLKSSAFGVAFVAVMLLVTWLSYRSEKAAVLMSILVVVNVLLALRLGEQWTFRISSYVKSNAKLVRVLESEPDAAIYYPVYGDENFVDFFQFELPDREITVVSGDEVASDTILDGFILVDLRDPLAEELAEKYDEYEDSVLFRIFHVD